MLKQRIITAIILVCFVLLALFNLDNEQISLVFGLIVLLAGHEVVNMAGLKALWSKTLFLLSMIGTMFYLQLAPLSADISSIFFTFISFYWFFTLIYLVRIPANKTLGKVKKSTLFNGFLCLIAAWLAIVELHLQGQASLILFLFVVIWGADSGAYFSGKRWGRVKLASVVSPGKTREGAYGAIFFAILCGLSMPYVIDIDAPAWSLVVLCVGTAMISIVGDLLESLWKRRAEMKDSGRLLPGHGGVMDRIDSLMAAAPVFLFGLMVIESAL